MKERRDEKRGKYSRARDRCYGIMFVLVRCRVLFRHARRAGAGVMRQRDANTRCPRAIFIFLMPYACFHCYFRLRHFISSLPSLITTDYHFIISSFSIRRVSLSLDRLSFFTIYFISCRHAISPFSTPGTLMREKSERCARRAMRCAPCDYECYACVGMREKRQSHA